MSIFSKVKNYVTRSNPLENPAVSLSSALAWINSGNPTESGELVNEHSALQCVTVYACVRVIAESVASLPLRLFERESVSRKLAIDNPLYNLLSLNPNPEMTAFTFFETLVGCAALTGNAYAQITRNQAGQVIRIDPLHPLKTEPVRLPSGSLAYKTTDGEAGGNARILASEDVLHIPLFGWDGLKGLSPIQLARQSIGLAKATEKFGARWFGNGSKPGGVLSTEQALDDKQLALAQSSWLAAQGGINQGKTAVLPGSWKYESIGVPPDQAQFLETRKYGRTDIAALFRVPPHYIGDTSRLSNSNHEQESLQFVSNTIRPYLTRIEQEIARKLLPTTGCKANKYFVEFNVRELLRADFATSMAGYALSKQWGIMTTNMILEDMGENPCGPQGDVLLYPLNMGNAEALLNSPATVTPAPAAPAPDTTARSLDQIASMYSGLVSDSVGRLTARNRRDFEAVSTTFGAVLTSFADQITMAARTQFKLDATWTAPTERILRDAMKSIEKRSASWTRANQAEASSIEENKTLRAISLNIYREAATAIAEKELNNG